MTKLPKRYGNCKCQCHNIKTIKHVVPCCSPKSEKSHLISIKFQPYQLEFIEKKAEEEGISKSAYLRKLMVETLKEEGYIPKKRKESGLI